MFVPFMRAIDRKNRSSQLVLGLPYLLHGSASCEGKKFSSRSSAEVRAMMLTVIAAGKR